MSKFILLIIMIFFHVWDDFGRQGILALMKQKSWWEEQKDYKDMYKYDYIVALFAHSFSWTVMIFIPIILYILKWSHMVNIFSFIFFSILFFVNMLLHAYIDNAKANKHTINLIQDQSFHLLQLFMLWLMVLLFV